MAEREGFKPSTSILATQLGKYIKVLKVDKLYRFFGVSFEHELA